MPLLELGSWWLGSENWLEGGRCLALRYSGTTALARGEQLVCNPCSGG